MRVLEPNATIKGEVVIEKVLSGAVLTSKVR